MTQVRHARPDTPIDHHTLWIAGICIIWTAVSTARCLLGTSRSWAIETSHRGALPSFKDHTSRSHRQSTGDLDVKFDRTLSVARTPTLGGPSSRRVTPPTPKSIRDPSTWLRIIIFNYIYILYILIIKKLYEAILMGLDLSRVGMPALGVGLVLTRTTYVNGDS